MLGLGQPPTGDLLAYDHAELTSLAAATVIFDLVALLARRP
jgi:hypothetical protein